MQPFLKIAVKMLSLGSQPLSQPTAKRPGWRWYTSSMLSVGFPPARFSLEPLV